MSRKTVLVLLTGVCVLGIIILSYNTSGVEHFFYGPSTNLTDYRNMEILKYIWTSDNSNWISSIGGQFSNNLNRVSLEPPTSLGPILSYQSTYGSNQGNISAVTATKSAGILQDLTTASATGQINTPTEVNLITTTMTFNKSLEVHCKVSPFIECVPPPVIDVISDKIFKVTFLVKPPPLPAHYVKLAQCRYKQCHFVDATNETDLTIVYGVALRGYLNLPQRLSHQLYAIIWWESPIYTAAEFLEDENSPWNNQFNLTINYRVDSDIFSPYGWLIFNPKPLEKRPNYYEIAKNKTKTAVWLVSHCSTQSLREQYVNEMKVCSKSNSVALVWLLVTVGKYIDVDTLGGCGASCSDKVVNCNDLSSTYKFYLSFENSLCTDYITEKFFKLFVPGMHVIPVVRGGADYDKYFPNFTFINAAHFKTPKDLALHLKNLAADLETYSKYLEYKDLYVHYDDKNGFCSICKYLHTHKSFVAKTYNLKKWAGDGHCHKPNDL